MSQDHYSMEEQMDMLIEEVGAIAARMAGPLSDAAFLDECAMRAMEAHATAFMLANVSQEKGPYVPFHEGDANRCYEYGDYMLAERKRRREGK